MIQQLGQATRNTLQLAFAIVFIRTKHYLPINDNALEGTDFVNARQPVFIDTR